MICKAVIAVLGRLRKQNSLEFKVSLVYIFNKRKASLDCIERPYLIPTPAKKKKKKLVRKKVSVKISQRYSQQARMGSRGQESGEVSPTKVYR